MTNIQTTTSPRVFRNPLDPPILAIAARFGDKSKEVERFLKFAVVGFIGAIVDFGTAFILQSTLFPPTDAAGNQNIKNVVIATTIAFIAAIISNFTWNRIWTYPDSRSRSMKQQLFLFTFISFVGWAGREVWIATSFHWLGQTFYPVALSFISIFRTVAKPAADAYDKFGSLMAQFIGVIVVMFWNYFINRLWTYNDVKS